MAKSTNKKRPKARRPSQASQADRHALYQEAVQCVEAEIDFVDETFRALRGRRARTLREDFCGTANTACEWVRRRRTNHALGVDLDPEVLEWGRTHNVAQLSEGQTKRIRLLQADVLRGPSDPFDVVLAMNFSYWLFQERALLRRYFRRVRSTLAEDGVFFLDAYGGYDSYKVIRDRHECDGFTYIWDQAEFNPITNRMRCHIHFRFADGSRLKRAFSYEWRLWSLPEVRDLLHESGFREVTVYWQGADEDSGEPNGIFEPEEEVEQDPAWIAYLTALP